MIGRREEEEEEAVVAPPPTPPPPLSRESIAETCLLKRGSEGRESNRVGETFFKFKPTKIIHN